MVSLLSLIESVRQKPKHVRSQYAFWTSLFLTVCIAVVWGFALRSKYTPEVSSGEILRETESSFIQGFGEIFASIRNMPNLFKGTFEYAKEPSAPVVTSKNLDLDALVASSTKAERTKEKQASSTLEE